MVALAAFVLSATEVALNVTVAGFGTVAGAVYVIGVPEALYAAESVPHAAPLQPAPESAQLTPFCCESFCTVAVKACFCPVARDWLVGAMLTTTATGAVIVILTVAVLLLSAAEVAMSETVAGLETVAGAVYVIAVPEPLDAAESVPHAAPLQPAPESVQLTPLFCASFCTVAVNVCVCPAITEAAVGATVTLTGGGSALTMTVAAALLLVSIIDEAVSVTVAGFGRFAGAA
jgi:hypothetical protein